MGMNERITVNKRVIARVDESLSRLPRENVQKYYTSLDMSDLGDISAISKKASFWTISPLKASMAALNRDKNNNANDWWNIFATHVISAENIPFELAFEGSGDQQSLKDSLRAKFPDDFVKDIGLMIVQLAVGSGTFLPFDVEAGLVHMSSRHRVIAQAQKPPVKSVPSGDVKLKSSDTKKTPRKK